MFSRKSIGKMDGNDENIRNLKDEGLSFLRIVTITGDVSIFQKEKIYPLQVFALRVPDHMELPLPEAFVPRSGNPDHMVLERKITDFSLLDLMTNVSFRRSENGKSQSGTVVFDSNTSRKARYSP